MLQALCQQAVVAQLVEHFHGKEKVSGSIPDNGSRNLRFKIEYLRFMNKEELQNRTKHFALRIIKLVDALPKTLSGKAIGNQIMRSGTSVAANYRAVCRARSKADFISKLGIVIEEADETAFWLELIIESKLLHADLLRQLLREAQEISAIMVCARISSVKNLKS